MDWIYLLLFSIFVLPIVSIFMLSGVKSRLTEIEEKLSDVQSTLANMRKYEIPGESFQAQPAAGAAEENVAAAEPIPTVEEAPLRTPPPIPGYAEPESFAAMSPAQPEKSGAGPLLPVTAAGAETAEPSNEREIRPPALPQEPDIYIQDSMPSFLKTRMEMFSAWLLKEGNIWVTAGVVTLLIGFGLLFSFMAQMGWFSLELRLSFSAVVGMVMVAFGWKMREKRRTYALILQGGGLGILYIVLLAGAKLGPIIPIHAAVVGMIMISLFTVIMANLQNFEPLALFALLGGYAAPILLRTGSSNHVALFSIYSLLNLEIAALSIRNDWRKCRWSGFLASIIVSIVWGYLNWRPEYFPVACFFLVLFFVTYNAICGIPLSGKFANSGSADIPMILTLPFAYLALQIAAAAHTEFGVAFSCLGLAAWYLTLGRFLSRSSLPVSEKLPAIFLTFCILFANLAVPFIFKRALSSTVWAIEGAFLVALAARTGKRSTLSWGMGLQVFAFLLYNLAPVIDSFLLNFRGTQLGLVGWGAGTLFPLTGLLFALSALFSSYYVRSFDFSEISSRLENDFNIHSKNVVPWIFSVYGTIWWALAVSDAFATPLSFPVLSVAAAAAFLLSRRLDWQAVRVMAVPPVVYAILSYRFLDSMFSTNPAMDLQSPLFHALCLASAFCVLRREAPTRSSSFAWGAVLFSWLILVESTLLIHIDSGTLARCVSFIPAMLAATLLLVDQNAERLAINDYRQASWCAVALVALLNAASFASSLGAMGSTVGGIYIPLANPLELWQAMYLATAFLLVRTAGKSILSVKTSACVMTVAVFIWINTIAMRASWWYFGERIDLQNMFYAPNFQAIVAILWGVSSLCLIYWGMKTRSRLLWFMGAGLLGMDIAKLLLIDLRNTATVIRIFAFLLLGGLFLLIGWMAPLPPKSPAESQEPEETASQ